MDFWIGQGVLKYEGFEEVIPLRVFLDLDLDLKIETSFEFGFQAILLGQREDLNLTIEGIPNPIRLLVSHARITSSDEQVMVFSPARSPLWKVSQGVMNRARASLVNFGCKESAALNTQRFLLEAGGWSVEMIPVGSGVCYAEILKSDEHDLTHQLEIRRTDYGDFTNEQIQKLFEDLGQFFSFCQGGWVGLALATGMNSDGAVVIEEWGVGRLGPLDELDGFINRHYVLGMVQLYPLFMKRMEDPAWADTISHVVYWLRRSNIDNAGPDGGIILIQATLERFAWHVLVKDKAISEKGFGDLMAADQLRLMISTLQLPKEVPSGLEELTRFAKAFGLDAAESFTRVRNRIVHPPKLRSTNEILPYYDAYRLGRWLAELAVLAACGYKGKYSNRTRKHQWAGQVEDVPWASS